MNRERNNLAALPNSASLGRASEVRGRIVNALSRMESNDEKLKRRFIEIATDTGNGVVTAITSSIKQNIYGPLGQQFNRRLDSIAGGAHRKWLSAAGTHAKRLEAAQAARIQFAVADKEYEATDPPWAINIFANLTATQAIAKQRRDAARVHLDQANAAVTAAKSELAATSRALMSVLMSNLGAIVAMHEFSEVAVATQKGNVIAQEEQEGHSAAQDSLLKELSGHFKELVHAYRG